MIFRAFDGSNHDVRRHLARYLAILLLTYQNITSQTNSSNAAFLLSSVSLRTFSFVSSSDNVKVDEQSIQHQIEKGRRCPCLSLLWIPTWKHSLAKNGYVRLCGKTGHRATSNTHWYHLCKCIHSIIEHLVDLVSILLDICRMATDARANVDRRESFASAQSSLRAVRHLFVESNRWPFYRTVSCLRPSRHRQSSL